MATDGGRSGAPRCANCGKPFARGEIRVRRGLAALHVECTYWRPATTPRTSIGPGRTNTGKPAVMSTYYVSLTVVPAAGIGDEALMRLFRTAARRARCVAIEVTPAGLVVEADAASLPVLEHTLRELIREAGGHVDRITATRI